MPTLTTLWLTVLGLFTAGYLVFDGRVFGLAAALPRLARTDAGRRETLSAVGPFFLLGEVWLVGAAGILGGAFPRAEGVLFTRLYPLLTAMLCALAVRDIALHTRSRRPSAAWRRWCDRAFTAAGTLLALTWGVLLGELAQGLPHRLANAPAAASGLGFAALAAAHGSLYARRRGGSRAKAVRAGLAVTSAAVAAFVMAAGAGSASVLRDGAADHTTLRLLAAVALPVVTALLACQAWLWRVFLKAGPRPLYW